MKISLNNFLGVAPRFVEDKLPQNYAAVCTDVKLMNGNIESFRTPSSPQTLPGTSVVNTIYPLNIESTPLWLSWNEDQLGVNQVSVDVTKGTNNSDTEQRIYYTGTDQPKTTNLSLATSGGTGDYPELSYNLGVPAPVPVPILIPQRSTTDKLFKLINPGGEEGDITGWTVNKGDFASFDDTGFTGVAPYKGDYYFFGGYTPTSEVVQFIDVEDYILSLPATTISLNWYHRKGYASNNGIGTMFIRLYDSAFNLLVETPHAMSVGPNTWTAAAGITILLNPFTKYIGIYYVASKNSTQLVSDYFIDEVTLSYSGDSGLYDPTTTSIEKFWNRSVESSNNSISTTTTAAAPYNNAIKIVTDDENTAYLNQNFALSKATGLVFSFLFYVDSHLDEVNFNAGFFNDVGGGGSGYGFRDGHLFSYTTKDFTDNGVALETDPTVLTSSTWYSFVLAAAQSGSIFNSNCTLTNLTTSAVISLGHNFAEVTGDYISFRQRVDGTDNPVIYMANITYTVTIDQTKASIENTVRSYVFTYVNDDGEEGPPSPVSRTLQLADNDSVLIQTPVTLFPDYNITKKRIYRTATANGQTDFYFVAEIPITQADYADEKTDSLLAEVLDTVDYDLPPIDGHSIISLPNGITLMASLNDIRPSIEYKPYAYPIVYTLSTEYPVVAMAAIDTSVVVATQSNPYMVIGNSSASLSMTKFEAPQGCVAKRSMVSLKGFGVIYASPNGLVGITAAGQIKVFTESLFSRDTWQAINPEEIRAISYDNRYYGFTNSIGFVYDPAVNAFSWLSTVYKCGYSNPLNDNLYLAYNDGVNHLVQWEGGGGLIPYKYKSKKFLLPRPLSFEMGQVKSEVYSSSSTFSLYQEGTLIYSKPITSEVEFRLPAKTMTRASLQVEGTQSISQVEVAERYEELE